MGVSQAEFDEHEQYWKISGTLNETENETENVNHPSHYQREGRKECIVEMQERFGAYITAVFCLTNAYKYLYRAGLKEGNSVEQDIQKARWYHDYAIHIKGIKFDSNEIKLLKCIRKELDKYD